MHPILQTSASSPYEFDPSKTSGARYHLVATPSVIMLLSLSFAFNSLANPKSQILDEQFESSKTFEGFKSL